jgi:hypothetical protein
MIKISIRPGHWQEVYGRMDWLIWFRFRVDLCGGIANTILGCRLRKTSIRSLDEIWPRCGGVSYLRIWWDKEICRRLSIRTTENLIASVFDQSISENIRRLTIPGADIFLNNGGQTGHKITCSHWSIGVLPMVNWKPKRSNHILNNSGRRR